MNSDLQPGRLGLRRFPLEKEYYGCDLFGYDNHETDIIDVQKEIEVYEQN